MSTRSIPSLHPLLRFAFIAGGLYLLWFFGYERCIALDGRLDAALTHNIASTTAELLRLLGFEATTSAMRPNMLVLNHHPSVIVGTYCDGMVLYALFSGFIIAFPGSSTHKFWFVPLGVVLIYGINVLRVAALSLNHHYSQRTIEFNHHYTFTFIVYGFIALLWAWWATRLAEPGSTDSSPTYA
ncbi:MAG: hypothetical protein EOO61_00510 [Hymenobacter sp.]|nr:MAG: hypothetical protein EOO61_00510 [Hymenobacter sp.]